MPITFIRQIIDKIVNDSIYNGLPVSEDLTVDGQQRANIEAFKDALEAQLLSAASETFDQVLAAGATLTEDRTVDLNNNDLTFQGAEVFILQLVSDQIRIFNTLRVVSGANKSIGTATLVGGTVTVSTTMAEAGSKIFVTLNTPEGTLGVAYSVPDASLVPGVSFVINSVSTAGALVVTDTSTINWWIIGEGNQ